MSSQIDFKTVPANVPVLCIPRVYPNISEDRIRKIFDVLNMGTLERIDIVPKTSEKGERFNRVFVHFKIWNNSDFSNIARERLLNGKDIKIIYDEPWFWKISAYREPERKPTFYQQTEDRGNAYVKKPTIAFDLDENKYSKPHVFTNRDNRPIRHYNVHDKITNPVESNRYERRPERPRQQNERHEEIPVRKFGKPNDQVLYRCSPLRQRQEEVVIQTPLDHEIILPPRKKRIYGKKPEPKVLNNEKEEGEIDE